MIDDTHNPRLSSWVASANGHGRFPIQNLPFGVASVGDGAPFAAVAIGDEVLDLRAAASRGLLDELGENMLVALRSPSLNRLMAAPAPLRQALRRRLVALLSSGSPLGEPDKGPRLLCPATSCRLHLPATIGDYTDFFAGIHHAVAAGRIMRPGAGLAPNYKHVPIAYHGRSSTIAIGGGPTRRPSGQRLEPGSEEPAFAPSAALDYEFEIGVWIGPGNPDGAPIPIGSARDHIFGFSILNDWSARDIQRWEAQPLGPFLAKNFATHVSPWIVTPEALAPFWTRQPERPPGDPRPLPHLWDDADQSSGALAVTLEASLLTPKMMAAGLPPQRISQASMLDLYWTPAQMVAHHTSNGCALRPGDLFGTGTISAESPDGAGCLLELTEGGRKPLQLPGGEVRTYLEDGDQITLSAFAAREGFAPIGLGECVGVIAPALSLAS